jgi:hypothetical protein
MKLKVHDEINALVVQFNMAVIPNTVTVSEDNRPGTFTVMRSNPPAGWSKIQSGKISFPQGVGDIMTFQLSIGTFAEDTYVVRLLGGHTSKDPAIRGVNGLRLDGEFTQLPSGNNKEGGDFEFRIIVDA